MDRRLPASPRNHRLPGRQFAHLTMVWQDVPPGNLRRSICRLTPSRPFQEPIHSRWPTPQRTSPRRPTNSVCAPTNPGRRRIRSSRCAAALPGRTISIPTAVSAPSSRRCQERLDPLGQITAKYGHDQRIPRLMLWPLIRSRCLVHDKYYRFAAGRQNIDAVLEEVERLGIPRLL
jgi:hypothetical protein